MAMIKMEHVNKYFGDLHVLKNVNLEVKEGEKLVIIGPSGSGKSTTVRCMSFGRWKGAEPQKQGSCDSGNLIYGVSAV